MSRKGIKGRDRAIVSVVRVEGDGVDAAVRRAVGLCGGMQSVVRKDSRVLIKPNLWLPAPSGSGLVTDCRVTESVTRLVLECNPASVIIGEGAAVGYDAPSGRRGLRSTVHCFEVSGTADVARRLGVEWADLNQAPLEEVEVQRPYVMNRVKIARAALETDCIISIPVLKTHTRSAITLSLKNMKGVMPGAEKRKTHRLGLEMAIVDLNSIVKPSFVVVDALAGMEGTWDPDDRRELGLIVAGSDAVAVDAVGARLIGLDPSGVMHIVYAERRGLGVADLQRIREVGEAAGTVVPFKSAIERFRSRYPEVGLVLGEEACTGCLTEIVGGLLYVRQAGFGEQLRGLVIQVGGKEAARNMAGFVAIGRCSKRFADLGVYVPGCPPDEDAVLRGLCTACGADLDFVRQQREEHRRKLWADLAAT